MRKDITTVMEKAKQIYLTKGRSKAMEYVYKAHEHSICGKHRIKNCPVCIIAIENLFNRFFNKIEREKGSKKNV